MAKRQPTTLRDNRTFPPPRTMRFISTTSKAQTQRLEQTAYSFVYLKWSSWPSRRTDIYTLQAVRYSHSPALSSPRLPSREGSCVLSILASAKESLKWEERPPQAWAREGTIHLSNFMVVPLEK